MWCLGRMTHPGHKIIQHSWYKVAPSGWADEWILPQNPEFSSFPLFSGVIPHELLFFEKKINKALPIKIDPSYGCSISLMGSGRWRFMLYRPGLISKLNSNGQTRNENRPRMTQSGGFLWGPIWVEINQLSLYETYFTQKINTVISVWGEKKGMFPAGRRGFFSFLFFFFFWDADCWHVRSILHDL